MPCRRRHRARLVAQHLAHPHRRRDRQVGSSSMRVDLPRGHPDAPMTRGGHGAKLRDCLGVRRRGLAARHGREAARPWPARSSISRTRNVAGARARLQEPSRRDAHGRATFSPMRHRFAGRATGPDMLIDFDARGGKLRPAARDGADHAAGPAGRVPGHRRAQRLRQVDAAEHGGRHAAPVLRQRAVRRRSRSPAPNRDVGYITQKNYCLPWRTVEAQCPPAARIPRRARRRRSPSASAARSPRSA